MAAAASDAPTRVRLVSRPRRISGSGVRFSTATNSAARATATANPAIVSALPQPASGAWTMVKTSSSIASVTVTAPATSYLRRPVPRAGSRGTRASAPRKTPTATGTGSRKVQRQPISVSRPPKIRPMEKPAAPQAV